MTTTEEMVICRHSTIIQNYISTCKYCGQLQRLDPEARKPPELIKRGRDQKTGKPTMVNPPLLPNVLEDTGASCPIRPDNWGKMPPREKGEWYDAHWAELEALVNKIGLKKARQAWGITIPTYERIAGRHTDTVQQSLEAAPNEPIPAPGEQISPSDEQILPSDEQILPSDEQILPPDEPIPPPAEPEPLVEEIVLPEPEPAVAEGTSLQKRQSPHYYYEENKTTILADDAALGTPAMLKKWGIPSSSWTYMKRRWAGKPSKHARSPSTRTVEASPEVTPEPIEQEVGLVADTRVTRRNQGMTGIRRLYPL